MYKFKYSIEIPINTIGSINSILYIILVFYRMYTFNYSIEIPICTIYMYTHL